MEGVSRLWIQLAFFSFFLIISVAFFFFIAGLDCFYLFSISGFFLSNNIPVFAKESSIYYLIKKIILKPLFKTFHWKKHLGNSENHNCVIFSEHWCISSTTKKKKKKKKKKKFFVLSIPPLSSEFFFQNFSTYTRVYTVCPKCMISKCYFFRNKTLCKSRQ